MADGRQYWETSVFIALVQGEAGRAETIARLFNDAQAGQFQIFTSVLTIAECSGGKAVAARGWDAIQQLNETLGAFLQHSCITQVQVDRMLAETAQRLQQWYRHYRRVELPVIDSLHLASAIRAQASVLCTYDDTHLIPLDGTQPLDLSAPLVIRNPAWTGTLSMFEGQPE